MKVDGTCMFIVTGGVSGLGLATATSLLSKGAFVAVLDRDADAAASALASPELLGKFNNQNPTVQYFQVDMLDQKAVDRTLEAVFEWAESRSCSISGVVAAAGVAWASRVCVLYHAVPLSLWTYSNLVKILDKDGNPTDLDLFKRVVDINLVGTYNVVRLVASHMAKRSPPTSPDNERGVIILVSSVAAFEGQTGQTAYAASKGGVAGLALPMARDLARFGIRVVAIAPSVFDTAMSVSMPEKTKSKLTSMLEFPARFGSASDFAHLALAVIGNPMLNGTVIRLDGATRMGKI